jgi:hypothetical protein
MYFLDAISYPFKSTSWAGKAFIAFLLTCIPIVNIFGAIVLSGYAVRAAREILSGRTELPEFDFGEDITKGFILLITSIVYGIPGLILSNQLQRSIVVVGGRATMTNISGGMVILLVILSIITSLFLLIAIARYIVTDDFGVFVDLGGNFNLLSRNLGTILMYGINVVLFGIVGLVLVMVGLVACIIPGIVVGIMLSFGRAYLLARFVEDLGLSLNQEKFKNDRPKNDFAR